MSFELKTLASGAVGFEGGAIGVRSGRLAALNLCAIALSYGGRARATIPRRR